MSTKGPGGGKPGSVFAIPLVAPEMAPVVGPILLKEEPSLRDVLNAVNDCKDSITSLHSQLKTIMRKYLLWGKNFVKIWKGLLLWNKE